VPSIAIYAIYEWAPDCLKGGGIEGISGSLSSAANGRETGGAGGKARGRARGREVAGGGGWGIARKAGGKEGAGGRSGRDKCENGGREQSRDDGHKSGERA